MTQKSKFYQVKKQGKQTTKAVVPGSNTVSLTVEDRQSHYLYCKVSGQRGKSPPEVKKRKKRRELAVLMISYLPPSLLLSSFQTERDSVTRFVLPHFFLSLNLPLMYFPKGYTPQSLLNIINIRISWRNRKRMHKYFSLSCKGRR